MTKRERIRALKALYAELPVVKCKGLCSASCTAIQCSKLEREIIETRAGKKLEVSRNASCSMLSHNGRCTVYGDRPMICRLWGAAPEMRCPHGCEVSYPMKSGGAMGFLAESMKVGGDPEGGVLSATREEMRKLLEADPELRAEMEAFIAPGMRNDARKMGL